MTIEENNRKGKTQDLYKKSKRTKKKLYIEERNHHGTTKENNYSMDNT